MKINLPNTLSVLRYFEKCFHIEEILKVTLQKSAPYGVDYVLIGVIPERNLSENEQLEHVIFGSVPDEWGQRYFSKNYLELDPTIDHVRNNHEILDWQAVSGNQHDNHQMRVMNEAREFQLNEGITIPHMSLDGLRIGASFSGYRMEKSIKAITYLNVLSAIAIMRALKLYKREGSPLLSDREKECLLWVAEGKSNWDISAIMGISQKTVEKHLSSCRGKLNAVNRSQAVVKAIHHGIIS